MTLSRRIVAEGLRRSRNRVSSCGGCWLRHHGREVGRRQYRHSPACQYTGHGRDIDNPDFHFRANLGPAGVILLKFVRRFFQKRRLALPRFPLKEIVFQVLCPKGKVRKFRSSLPTHARTNPPYSAIRGFVGPKRFRSCVSNKAYGQYRLTLPSCKNQT